MEKHDLADEGLVTTGYVSKWLGIPARTLCLWAECGEIPAIKLRRQWRFRRSDIKVWYESRAKQTSSESASKLLKARNRA
jgi:excisionase family DNA binding protein